MPFPTGDGLPVARRVYALTIPDVDWYYQVISGLLDLITVDDAWEQEGSTTPGDAADESLRVWYEFKLMPNLTGTMLLYGGDISLLPDGYLICDGSTYSEPDFENLYAVIARRYTDPSVPLGDFQVPNLSSPDGGLSQWVIVAV